MYEPSDELGALIAKCDLLKVRELLLEAHRQANEEAASQDQVAYFKSEYANAWYAFRDNPGTDTAHALLTAVPELRRFFERYSVDRTFEGGQIELPLRRLVSAIVLTTSQLKQELDEIFGYSGQVRPSEQQTYMFYESLYFFTHLVIRTSASRGFTQAQAKKLLIFLKPTIVLTAVDTFSKHWPEDLKAKMYGDVFEKLDEALLEYAEHDVLFSKEEPLNEQTLIGVFASNVAELSSASFYRAKAMAVALRTIKAVHEMDLERLTDDVLRVIDSVDLEQLQRFWNLKGVKPRSGSTETASPNVDIFERAALFAGAVTEATQLLANAVERSPHHSDDWTGEPRAEILWICLTFVLHLTDRIVFSVASGDRDLFMNRLVEILAEKIDRGEVGEMRQLPGEGFVRIRRGDDLKTEYNAAQRHWSRFKLWREDKGVGGTLTWEFAKTIGCEMYDQCDPALITLVSICATETFGFLTKVFTEMRRGPDAGTHPAANALDQSQ